MKKFLEYAPLLVVSVVTFAGVLMVAGYAVNALAIGLAKVVGLLLGIG
jgi:hypothetical protein